MGRCGRLGRSVPIKLRREPFWGQNRTTVSGECQPPVSEHNMRGNTKDRKWGTATASSRKLRVWHQPIIEAPAAEIKGPTLASSQSHVATPAELCSRMYLTANKQVSLKPLAGRQASGLTVYNVYIEEAYTHCFASHLTLNTDSTTFEAFAPWTSYREAAMLRIAFGSAIDQLWNIFSWTRTERGRRLETSWRPSVVLIERK